LLNSMSAPCICPSSLCFFLYFFSVESGDHSSFLLSAPLSFTRFPPPVAFLRLACCVSLLSVLAPSQPYRTIRGQAPPYRLFRLRDPNQVAPRRLLLVRIARPIFPLFPPLRTKSNPITDSFRMSHLLYLRSHL